MPVESEQNNRSSVNVAPRIDGSAARIPSMLASRASFWPTRKVAEPVVDRLRASRGILLGLGISAAVWAGLAVIAWEVL